MHFPWRIAKNRWHALAVEVMLQRTRARWVIAVYVPFSERYLVPSDYLRHIRAELFRHLGLSWREGTFRELTRVISETGIPSKKEELLELPGVGDYIAVHPSQAARSTPAIIWATHQGS